MSNRKTAAKEDGKLINEIKSLRQEIKDANSRTLGEYLALQPKKRGHHTDRAMHQEEFEALWQAQHPHYPELLTSALKVRLHNTIFFQRPLKVQKHLVGNCTFEPTRKRAARALQDMQRFRILQDLNHLTVKDPISREYTPIGKEDRNKLFNLLEKQKTLSWEKARKVLGLHENETFNLEEGKKRELLGNRTAYTLRSILGSRWDDMSKEEQDSLVTDMLTIDNEQGFLNRLKTHWKFDDTTAEKLAQTELEPGYARLSLKAIRKILPYLEQGQRYDEACQSAGYNHSKPDEAGSANELAAPPYLRNPVVQKALFETRKVVNAIIRQYGRPQTIRVEMARDMKLSRKQKSELHKAQNERQKANNHARQILQEEFKIKEPTRADIQKHQLWQECREVCPYTGTIISASMLFSPEVDVEHILPYKQSLDDSYMNKTLCMAKENRAVKKDRSPYEAYHANETKYQEILQRTRALPWAKRRKFEQKEIDTDKFVERQLNDTRYICVEVKNYLRQLGATVDVSKGGATAALRRQWGMNGFLAKDGSAEKNREDHRHHAVDAMVIALTNRALFQQISKIAVLRDASISERGFVLEAPWPAFYQDVKSKLDNMIVSHAANRRISGALHEDTAYGYSEADRCFVYRKPLANLTANEVEKIRDGKVKILVKARLEQYQGNLKKTFGDETNPLLHADGKTPIRTVRLAVNFDPSTVHGIRESMEKPYKFFKYGNNHHVEIIENIKTGKRKGIFVTAMEAARRARSAKTDIVQRDHGPEWKFIMSLSINDMVEVETDGQRRYYRVRALDGSNAVIDLRYHTAATLDDKTFRLFKTPGTFQGQKVIVNALGNISTSYD